MFEGIIYDENKLLESYQKDCKNGSFNIISPQSKRKECRKHVAIKRSNKKLCHNFISEQDDMTMCVDEHIFKESVILNYLTCKNSPTGEYLVQFINFFESDTDYFLIMEYVSDITLKEFNKKVHKYIKSGKIKIKQWQRITKYIFWQLAVILHVK